jgi:hypothetical protein
MLSFFVAEFDRRNESAKILIPFEIERDKRQQTTVVHRDLSADDRLYPALSRLKMKPHRTGHRVAIKQSNRRYAKISRAIY